LSVSLFTYYEHAENVVLDPRHTSGLTKAYYLKKFTKYQRGQDANIPCYTVTKKSEESKEYFLNTSYFIGLDWIETNKSAIYVASKLNNESKEIDFTSMLFSSLQHDSVSNNLEELFEVKLDKPVIEISQRQDILTPFLVVEFLSLLKKIVKKGLKKSYYRVEQNLQSRVKGKVLVAKTIKKNLVTNKSLYTYCRFDEFGVNNKENRLLKKALLFVKRYLPTYGQLANHNDLQNTFNYINPAFTLVSDNIEVSEIKQTKTNVFYKEYEQALYLGKLILKRFGYNISNTVKEKVKSPPFWIDMSKLFELYVLGLLKDRFYNNVKFQYKYCGNELDYLLNSEHYQMVIDAKYKLKYLTGKHDEDIRQVSGYARLKNVYKALKKEQGQIIDCLIIHPDQDNGLENLDEIDLKQTQIDQYYDVYKLGVKLPLVKE